MSKGRRRSLTSREQRFLALLGLPTLGLALAITTVTTYLPLLAQRFTSSAAIIGLVIAAEGLVALVVPLVVGQWSDQLETRIGGRVPFVIAGAPLLALAVGVMGFAGSLIVIAVLVLLFFLAYYAAYEPYRALYADTLEARVAGRGQSTQAVFRGVGTGLALVGGGVLFGLARPLPFAVAGLVALGTMGLFSWRLVRRGFDDEQHGEERSARETLVRIAELIRERRDLRAFLAANVLWELALAALKTFVVLYLTVGLGYRLGTAVAIIGAVAVLILVAALVSGKIGDRFGKARVATIALWIFGVGLLIPFLTRDPWILIPSLPFVAFGGGTILTLPYALLIPIMPDDEHGMMTGFYSFTRGLGILLGPLVGGAAITLLRQPLGATQGYAAMWLVCSAAILASVAVMGPLRRRERSARERRGARASAQPEGAAG